MDYNKAHLMGVRYKVALADGNQQAPKYIARPSCLLRFFETDRRSQHSKVRVMSIGRLPPVEQTRHWDPLVPDGPDRARVAARVADEAEGKGMHDLAALVRRQYGL